ncbi:MAG: 30S ribosomal protein S6 [Candidatus Omnitrophica bacterium]|nr:30S ribosomal protein S6 [Candidatus Omnitrophota bacterium]
MTERYYEAMIILFPGATPEKSQEEIQKVKDVISKFGGAVQSEVKWGKRTMAYTIKKKREGYYLLLHFQAKPSSIKPMTQAWKLMEDDVIRILIVQKDQPQLAKVA